MRGDDDGALLPVSEDHVPNCPSRKRVNCTGWLVQNYNLWVGPKNAIVIDSLRFMPPDSAPEV